jgi:L,D-peptidoglycan transpeptidase YkuD (ErfK/YbiS/YcfS/YnhG family)
MRPNRNPVRGVRWIVVNARSQAATRGTLRLGGRHYCCALGKGGRRALKREGDGATPIGAFPVRFVLFRQDRIAPPATGLSCRPIRTRDGWCDAADDRNYNRMVTHPYPVSAECLWREDALYDLVVVLGINDIPRRRGAGSAIFMHLARPGYRPTEGCIALTRRDLQLVLACIGPRTRLRVCA